MLEQTSLLWNRAFRAAMAHRRMLCKARGGRVFDPPEVPASLLHELKSCKTSAITENRRASRVKVLTEETVLPPPPSGRQYKKRHPLAGSLRSRLVPWVFGKTDTKMESLVCMTAAEFRIYIASKFTEGMNWANHGYWHLDHILPVASFNHDDPEQVKNCWHFTNFQPLWGRHNSQKGAKLNYGKDTDRTNLGVEEEKSREVQGLPEGTHAQEEGDQSEEARKETVD